MREKERSERTRIYTFLNLPEETKDSQVVVFGVPCARDNALQETSAADAVRRSNKIDFCRLNPQSQIMAADGGDINLLSCGEAEYPPISSKAVFVVGDSSDITNVELRLLSEKYGKISLVRFSAHEITFDAECIDTDHSIQVGVRDRKPSGESGIRQITGKELHDMSIDECSRIIKNTTGSSRVFVSFAVDFLDPAFAPGACEPACGGFSVYEAMRLIRGSFNWADIIGGDIVGFLPVHDSAELTVMAAECILNEILAGLSFQKNV